MDPNEERNVVKKNYLKDKECLNCPDEKSNHKPKNETIENNDLFTLDSNQIPSTSKQNGPTGNCSIKSDISVLRDTGVNYRLTSKDMLEAGPSRGLITPSIKKLELGGCRNDKLIKDRQEGCNGENLPSTSDCHNVTSDCHNVSDLDGTQQIESRKRPSSLRLNKLESEGHDSSSDTGNDDYSLGSEDGCIYTYRGGNHLADLPSSFFSLDMGLPHDNHLPMPPNYPVRAENPPANRGRESRASSPDMDFLEMDFDPGPSCDAEDGDASSPDVTIDVEVNLPKEEEPVLTSATVDLEPIVPRLRPECLPSCSSQNYHSVPSTSRAFVSEIPTTSASTEIYGKLITHVNNNGDRILVRRTTSNWMNTSKVNLHHSSGDLISPRELLSSDEEKALAQFSHQIDKGDGVSMSTVLYHLTMAKKLLVDKSKEETPKKEEFVLKHSADEDSSDAEENATEPQTCMIWTESEACDRQVTQIGTSACGATAVVNVFLALGLSPDKDRISAAIGTRQRANNAPIPRYLLSRTVAGCTADDLISGIYKASDGQVTARFFPTYPERAFSLSHWLADWISLGAVPILTLNLQEGCDGEIPDAWHHQMVFGVSPHGIYLCNPIECVKEEILWPRLASPSTLLVRSRDVISRFTPLTDLTPLTAVPDLRYHTFNVLGQVVNVIREWRAAGFYENAIRTRHIKIPASYKAGITVAALTGSDAHRKLTHANQLPILGQVVN